MESCNSNEDVASAAKGSNHLRRAKNVSFQGSKQLPAVDLPGNWQRTYT